MKWLRLICIPQTAACDDQRAPDTCQLLMFMSLNQHRARLRPETYYFAVDSLHFQRCLVFTDIVRFANRKSQVPIIAAGSWDSCHAVLCLSKFSVLIYGSSVLRTGNEYGI